MKRKSRIFLNLISLIKNQLYFFALIFGIVFFTHCSTKNLQLSTIRDSDRILDSKYAILPFEDAVQPPYRIFAHGATNSLGDVLEIQLHSLGLRVLDRAYINRILEESQLTATGLTEPQISRIGKILNADILVVGKLTSYVQGQTNHPATGRLEYSRVGFTIRAIRVINSEVVWSGSIYLEKNGMFNYTTSIENLTIEAIRIFTKELDKKIKKR